MPVIIFASSKGGAGKTTACVVLACELARQARPDDMGVSLIDADPNQHSAAWARLEGKPDNLHLLADVGEDGIIEVIETAQSDTPFVLVDLEGVADSAVLGAVSRADLVIIPCQASQNDAAEAARTVRMIRYGARIARRDIPVSVLFTRLGAAIVTRTGRHLAAEFEAAGVHVMSCALIEREAFRSIFTFGGTVNDLKGEGRRAQAGIDRAADNVSACAEEVKRRLQAIMQTTTPAATPATRLAAGGAGHAR